MKQMSVLLSAMLIQATVSVFAQVKPVGSDRIRIDMSEFIDTGVVTVDEVLVGAVPGTDIIYPDEIIRTDYYVEPKRFFVDMYRSSKVLPGDPLNIEIPGIEFQVDSKGLRHIVSLPEQHYTDIENGHGYVDLGLSVKWATCNLGADSPGNTGGRYAWGEVSTKQDYTWQNYRFNSGGEGYWDVKLSKYNSDSKLGPADMLEELKPEDDAAHVNWGGKWRIPTAQEFLELANNCTFVWAELNGCVGSLIISNKPGYTDRYIFLPATRTRTDGVGTADANYWSSTTNLTDRRGSENPGPCSSYTFYMCDNSYFEIRIWLQNQRSFGLPIRPVCQQ